MWHSRFVLLSTIAIAIANALRNVDRCEALILTNSMLAAPCSSRLRNGLLPLIEDAAKEDTLVAVIGPALPGCDKLLPSLVRRFDCPGHQGSWMEMFEAFTRARTSLNTVADGFGGSDGFGSQPSAGEREPRAAWTVAFVTTYTECEAALRAGLRTVALPADENGYIDDSLEGVADAILDDLDELSGIDDLSTPGAFWLNPAMPHDGEGYAVDPETGLRPGETTDGDASRAADADVSELSDEEAASLLDDVDPRL